MSKSETIEAITRYIEQKFDIRLATVAHIDSVTRTEDYDGPGMPIKIFDGIEITTQYEQERKTL